MKLTILPAAAERGQTARLVCDYDLEGGKLYCVKWYRGQHEFYSYTTTPNGPPKTKVYALGPGITVDVSSHCLAGLSRLSRSIGGTEEGASMRAN